MPGVRVPLRPPGPGRIRENVAACPSGQGSACKAVHTGSIPVAVSRWVTGLVAVHRGARTGWGRCLCGAAGKAAWVVLSVRTAGVHGRSAVLVQRARRAGWGVRLGAVGMCKGRRRICRSGGMRCAGWGCCRRSRAGRRWKGRRARQGSLRYAGVVSVVARELPKLAARVRSSSPARRLRPDLAGYADVAQLAEHHLAKVGAAGSNPVIRSGSRRRE